MTNNFQSWKEFFESIPDVENHFFTKEQGEVVGSYLQARANNIYLNLLDTLENLEGCKFVKFFTIRKIGTQLLQNQKQRLNAINKSQELYINWCTAQVEGLTKMSETFSNNPIVDVKQAVLSLIIETQIVTQITRLGTQTELLEKELERNHFCIECCDGGGF